jgi:hypothetical protein
MRLRLWECMLFPLWLFWQIVGMPREVWREYENWIISQRIRNQTIKDVCTTYNYETDKEVTRERKESKYVSTDKQ